MKPGLSNFLNPKALRTLLVPFWSLEGLRAPGLQMCGPRGGKTIVWSDLQEPEDFPYLPRPHQATPRAEFHS